MKKLTMKKVILGHVLAIMSFAVISQTAIPTSKNGYDEKTYFDPKELTSSYVSWGINPNNPASINLLPAWKKFKKKKEIVVAVVDTGIDREHPFLEKNIFVETGEVNANNFGVDFSKDKISNGTPTDNHGHGTHVSGIIKSIYPDVKILALKYYNPNASGTDNVNSTIEALRYAVNHSVDIINYSGGGPEAASEELSILKEAEKKGILLIAAAGNEESNIDNKEKAYFPASYGLKNIITVSAHDEDLNILSSSNYGKKTVDIFAPGYRIKSSLQNGRSGYLTGTSQATAFVTGVAALIKANFPQLSNERIKEIIKASVKKEKKMEEKCSSGGHLDAGAALNLASQMADGQNVQRQVANSLTNKKVKAGKIIYRIAN